MISPEPGELVSVVSAEETRGEPALVVHEIEQRQLDVDERLDPLEQLSGDRGHVVGAAERGRDRREGLELRLADRRGSPAPERPQAETGQSDPDDDRRNIEPDPKHARLLPG